MRWLLGLVVRGIVGLLERQEERYRADLRREERDWARSVARKLKLPREQVDVRMRILKDGSCLPSIELRADLTPKQELQAVEALDGLSEVRLNARRPPLAWN